MGIEQEQSELAKLETNILAHFEQKGVAINKEAWQAFLPSIKFQDLSGRQEKLEYRLEKLFALVNSQGEVAIDQNEFNNLSGELPKRHIILHELGHRIDQAMTINQVPEMERIGQLISHLPPEQMSGYVNFLAGEFKDEPNLAQIIRQEAMPELIAQFLESDGTFRGMIEAKMWSEPAFDSEQIDDGSIQKLVSELENFEEMDDERRSVFFEENPHLVDHYDIYQNLQAVMTNQELMDQAMGSLDEGEDYEIYDDIALVENLPARLQKLPEIIQNKKSDQKTANGPGFLWLFQLMP